MRSASQPSTVVTMIGSPRPPAMLCVGCHNRGKVASRAAARKTTNACAEARMISVRATLSARRGGAGITAVTSSLAGAILSPLPSLPAGTEVARYLVTPPSLTRDGGDPRDGGGHLPGLLTATRRVER